MELPCLLIRVIPCVFDFISISDIVLVSPEISKLISEDHHLLIYRPGLFVEFLFHLLGNTIVFLRVGVI